MIKKKEYLLITLFISFIFACKLPTASNAGSGASIIDKYPYWNITISEFYVDPKAKDMVLTVDQKKFAIEALALMKLVINTKEFEEAVLNDGKVYYSHKAGVFEGGQYNITEQEKSSKPLDKKRLLEVIRSARFSVKYMKSSEKDLFRGAMGELSYAFYGYRPYNTGQHIQGSYTRFEQPKREVFWFASSAFHEHLHNLGFAHISNDGGVPYAVGTNILQDIARRITGEKAPFDPALQQKYQKDLQQLTDYYLKLYAKDLQHDTLHPDAKS